MQSSISLHYVYLHNTKNSNIPFYIGIGTKQYGDVLNSKIRYARAYSKGGRSDFWKRVVSKYGYEVQILIESNDYDYIKEQEIYFISKYGRRDSQQGTLCNLTDGGDGVLGCKFSEESKKKMSETAKRNILNGTSAICKKDYKVQSERLKGNQYAKGSKRTKEELKNLKEKWIEKNGRRIIQEDLNGDFIKEWWICKEAAEFYGITYKAIWKACKGYPKTTSKGFKWKFK